VQGSAIPMAGISMRRPSSTLSQKSGRYNGGHWNEDTQDESGYNPRDPCLMPDSPPNHRWHPGGRPYCQRWMRPM
jgi:hypothetical protein